MLDSIKSFFKSSMSPPAKGEVTASRKDIRLAACALLVELAHADDEFSEDEREHLESAVQRQFGLDAPRRRSCSRSRSRSASRPSTSGSSPT